MKNRIAAIVQACLLTGLIVCMTVSVFAGKSSGPVTLTYAEVNPLEGTISGEMAKAFKEKAEEVSGGMLKIDIQAGAVLGSEEQILDNLLGGGNITDITRVSSFAFKQYGCDKSSLLAIPYTFEDEDHFWKFADSDLADELLMEPHDKGLLMRGLCYGEEGFRNFFFKDDVNGIEDLKNKKIRISADPVMTSMVDDLGAAAANVSFQELYSALSTGVVDGAEQPTANYQSNAFYEVAPNLMLDGHILGAMQIVISDYSWNKLDEEQQGWIMEAADYASDVCREKVHEIEEENIAKLKEKGVKIVELEDKSEWMENCKDTIDANTKNEYETYQKILAMKDKAE
ncbi:TRAP transporter substrate-binding protein [Lachnospiraceae bacterium C1.1]|nr:TRAP transporter substrate-binding protein [Lachnospiraceae bacterium C1.1]